MYMCVSEKMDIFNLRRPYSAMGANRDGFRGSCLADRLEMATFNSKKCEEEANDREKEKQTQLQWDKYAFFQTIHMPVKLSVFFTVLFSGALGAAPDTTIPRNDTSIHGTCHGLSTY